MKDRWVQLTDDEAAALVQGGKYREEKPTWVRRADSIWVKVDAQFKAWREHCGNRSE